MKNKEITTEMFLAQLIGGRPKDIKDLRVTSGKELGRSTVHWLLKKTLNLYTLSTNRDISKGVFHGRGKVKK